MMFAFVTLAPVAAIAVAAAPQAVPTRAGLEARVGAAPQVVARSDGAMLGYELHLTNYDARPIRLQSLDIVDADSGRSVATYADSALAALVGGQWVPTTTRDRGEIAGGGRAVLFVDRALVSTPPRRVSHRITYAYASGPSITVATPAVAIARAAPVVLGPPLRGGPWAAVYAPEMEFGHRRFVYAIDGVARVPGRYAIDFFGADRRGTTRPERYDAEPGYGADVLAVADGVVAATRDDVRDPIGPADKPAPTLDAAAGNFVVLDLGGGRFASYEHLRQGVRVRPGDRVRRGQVIGALGATGHVGGAHLHFHVGDGRDPLRAEGLPFAIAGFERLGAYGSIAAFDARADWLRDTGRYMAKRMPSPNAVIRFDTRES